MRDHHIILEDGRRVKVAELPTEKILDCLRCGIEVMNDDGGNCTENDILERLRIELVARGLGL